MMDVKRLEYGQTVYGIFYKRLNRFVAEVFIQGKKEKVHVKNTGRLKELLQQGADVQLEVSSNPNRKTKYSLIAAKKDGSWVNIDSQAPNVIAYEALKTGRIREFGFVEDVKREVTYRHSRFDLSYRKGDDQGFIEVKGVTLKKGQIAMFPDAPTMRGTKHVNELIQAVRDGYQATVLFIVSIQGCRGFKPNQGMDRQFSNALREAADNGVQILAYDVIEKDRRLVLNQQLPVIMSE